MHVLVHLIATWQTCNNLLAQIPLIKARMLMVGGFSNRSRWSLNLLQLLRSRGDVQPSFLTLRSCIYNVLQYFLMSPTSFLTPIGRCTFVNYVSTYTMGAYLILSVLCHLWTGRCGQRRGICCRVILLESLLPLCPLKAITGNPYLRIQFRCVVASIGSAEASSSTLLVSSLLTQLPERAH